jgi:hypothetical protein
MINTAAAQAKLKQVSNILKLVPRARPTLRLGGLTIHASKMMTGK